MFSFQNIPADLGDLPLAFRPFNCLLGIKQWQRDPRRARWFHGPAPMTAIATSMALPLEGYHSNLV
jgi:hypothetical protein